MLSFVKNIVGNNRLKPVLPKIGHNLPSMISGMIDHVKKHITDAVTKRLLPTIQAIVSNMWFKSLIHWYVASCFYKQPDRKSRQKKDQARKDQFVGLV